MSKIFRSMLGASALLVAAGAAQLAIGGPLGKTPDVAKISQAKSINRDAKGDRDPVVASAIVARTAVQTNLSNATSVAVRVVPQKPQHDGAAVNGTLRRPVACEAPASVLVDSARAMASGRCIT